MGRMTKRIPQRIALTIAMVLAIAGLTAPMATAQSSARSDTDPDVTYYLALGDSLSVGFQPVDPAGEGTPTEEGYVDDLYHTLKQSEPGLQLVNLGCPGESTTTMINGGCPYHLVDPTFHPYDTGSQLGDAEKFIKDHPGQVSHITITIGSNDVLHTPDGVQCVVPTTGIIAACALAGIGDVHRNLPTILNPLRDLTGRGAVRAGMTYYDPYLAAWLLPTDDGKALAKQSLTYINVLNAVLALGYLHSSFRVAPVAYAFQTNNFAVQNFPGFGKVPTNVGNICAYTWMCSRANIHPNALGYSKIADVFAKTFGHW